MAGLNTKQLAFITAYLLNNSITESAKQAGYSDKTAHSQGSRLLKHAEVCAEIDRRRAESQKTADFTREQFLEEVARTISVEKGAAKTAALRLYADILGWTTHKVEASVDFKIQLIDSFNVPALSRGAKVAELAEAEVVDLEEGETTGTSSEAVEVTGTEVVVTEGNDGEG